MAGSTEKGLVPQAIISLDGSRLPAELEAVVKEVVVTGRINAASSFQVKIALPMGKPDDVKKWIDKSDFNAGSKVKIKMGYKDAVEDVFSGETTSVSYEFQEEGGGNIITIRGFDLLHKLNRGKKTVSFARKGEADIVKDIASAVQLSTDIGQMAAQKEFTLQKNMTDFEYIRYLARKNNCIIWCDADKLYVKPVQASLQEVAVLERGKTLFQAQLNLAAHHLPSEVEVRGWDPAKFEAVVGTAKAGDITVKVGGSTLGVKKAQSDFGDAKLTHIDESVADSSSADKVALAILTNSSFDFITGTVTTYGNNKIKAASLVKLEGVGDRFSGKYLVESVKHHLSVAGGYRSIVSIRRNATK